MDANRKKELREYYKQRKPEMGIVCFFCRPSNKYYIGYLTDTTAKLNSFKARLGGNMFRGKKNGNIQQDWNKYGEQEFTIEIIDTLDYDKDDLEKIDYTEELDLLADDWLVKYANAEKILW